MKKFTSLLIGCSLALAGVAFAQQPQQPEEQQSPAKTKKQGQEKTHAAEAKPGANAEQPEGAARKQPGARHERGAGKGRKGQAGQESPAAAATTSDASAQAGATATPGATQQAERGRKGKKGREGRAEKTAASPAATAAGAAGASPATGASPEVTAAGQQTRQANVAGAGKKKPDPQKVQQIKQQHTNFRAQAKPQQVPAVTFNQSYRIQGSDRWQGPQYEVFRSYRPERHDANWYRSRYPRVELIGGGYYYFNSGYWYPAWGYSPSEEYYAYDAPIYVGQRAQPPDQVIADVQAVLQEMGYYRGEVDGLLGPLTREALTAYQADQGLMTTAVIDQPTLDSLGMG